MNNRVCMPSSYFALFILIGASVIVFALWQVNQQAQQIRKLNENHDFNTDTISQMISDKMKQGSKALKKAKSNVEDTANDAKDKVNEARDKANDTVESMMNPIYGFNYPQIPSRINYQRIYDPLSQPLKSYHTMSGDRSRLLSTPVNIPTRGEYGPFQQVGFAHKHGNSDQMFPVFGRYMHSNKYEYYVLHPLSQIKIPIRVKNDWELNKDDRIRIPGFPGEFTVEIYDLDEPRYI